MTMVNTVGGRKSTGVITATTLGLGLVGTVYYFLSRKFAKIFAFQRSIRVELEDLREEIRQLKSAQNSNPVVKAQIATTTATKVLKSSLKKNVKFAGGYDTADDEEYVTASSSEVSSSEDDPGQFEDLSSLARRVPGSEKYVMFFLKKIFMFAIF